MSPTQLKKLEKMATETSELAKKALRKSNELEALLSVAEYKAGKINTYRSVKELLKKVKRT